MLMFPALLIAIIGAVPTYINVYQAHRLGVPFGSVEQAIEQNQLWQKNYNCTRTRQPQTITTERNTRIETTLCPTGDILVSHLEPPNLTCTMTRWIGVDTFKEPQTVTASLFASVLNKKTIADKPLNLANSKQQIAQTEKVLCQKWVSKGILQRRVMLSNGNCVDRFINTYTGTVKETRNAPCNSQC
jgi:hypothetical protein